MQKRVFSTSVIVTFVAAVYLFRQWAKNWGAAAAEVSQPLPGDDIVPRSMLQTTHAISIQAPVARVWPWLVQMGYYRAGWYTDPDWWDYWPDRLLRRLVRQEAQASGYAHRNTPSADNIVPEFQQLRQGDVVLDGPPSTAYFVVKASKPERLLALHSTSHLRYVFPRSIRENPTFGVGGEFSWSFVLREQGAGATRLILRTRGLVYPWWYRLTIEALLPFAHMLLARKMLNGIKRRAEQAVGISMPALNRGEL